MLAGTKEITVAFSMSVRPSPRCSHIWLFGDDGFHSIWNSQGF